MLLLSLYGQEYQRMDRVAKFKCGLRNQTAGREKYTKMYTDLRCWAIFCD